ncbi:hypothetical protein JXA40_02155, partial [bacterium]|nr:hypothetical protein [candidate division CSSED10-310 bacterium]
MSESKNQQRTLTKRPDPLIFCEILHDDNPIESDDGWVSSPIRCFDQAVDENPEIIVVNFGKTAQSDRKTLLELATALKRNNHTKNCPVLALLHSKHRKLIEELKLAKVDYVRYIG